MAIETAGDYSLEIARNEKGRPTGRILSGVDDGHPFSIRVPLRCKTVEQALDWLRPEECYPDDPRQGDLWFVPDSPPSLTDGWELVDETEAGSCHYMSVNEFEDERVANTRHVAELLRIEWREGQVAFIGRKGGIKTHFYQSRPIYYVRGEVRHPEHAPLLLNDWHRVIPNRAVEQDFYRGGGGD